MQCDDGDVKLLIGEIMGQVEVCTNKRWATVCYSINWGYVDASVVCKQLGYSSGESGT